MAGAGVDVVLINPPWPTDDERAHLQNCLPPLGLLSIAARLEQAGVRVAFIDVHAERLDEDALRVRLEACAPRWVGLSVLTNTCVAAHAIARLCKRVLPACRVVAGGVHAEAMPERMLRNRAFDAVARGDGEELMLELAGGRAWPSIAGLSYRDGAQLRHNPPRPQAADLDALPRPAFHLAPLHRYRPAPASYWRLPALNLLMTRGCPGRCTFCNSARTPLRARSPRRMVEDIVVLHRRFGIRQIQFYDDTFTVLRREVMEFCRLLADAAVDVTWTAYIRADCFSDELAAAMRAAGCRQVLIGVETGSARLAAIIGKPIDRERHFRTVAIARRHGLETRGSFIIGNPGETRATLSETLDFALALDLDLIQLNVLTPYPGTSLYREAAGRGALAHRDWVRYGQGEPLLAGEPLDARALRDFERYAYRRFYLRPRTLWRLLRRLRGPRMLRDYLAAGLSLIVAVRGRIDPAFRAWAGHDESAFLDLDLPEPALPHLTMDVRAHGIGIAPSAAADA